MNAPRVSVIMPVHNAARFVADAIRSVLAQTHRELELLIVDDASTDGSAEVIARFADARIQYERSEHPLNAAGARNLALSRARGDFVAFLDADDFAEPTRLARQLVLLRDADLCASLITLMDEAGRTGGGGFVRRRHAAAIAPTLLFENCVALSSVTARRDALLPFRPEFAPAEDYDLWCRLAPDKRLVIHPRRLTRYRTHSGGVTARQPDLMRAAVTSIQAAQLARLGIPFSPIHAQLCEWPLQSTMEKLEEAERWLLALRDANARRAIYPRAVFQRVLADQWFTVCLDSWQLGWPVWRLFHSSSLAAPSLLQRAKLFRRVFAR